MPQTSGLVMMRDYRASEDAPVVGRLRQAGLIPTMVTNVSELCMWYESANRLNGRSCNPYNTARIVGGSSGEDKRGYNSYSSDEDKRGYNPYSSDED